MEITIGWWAVPTLITLGVLIYGIIPSRRPGQYGDIAGAFMFMVGLCVCLASWLIWSLLT